MTGYFSSTGGCNKRLLECTNTRHVSVASSQNHFGSVPFPLPPSPRLFSHQPSLLPRAPQEFRARWKCAFLENHAKPAQFAPCGTGSAKMLVALSHHAQLLYLKPRAAMLTPCLGQKTFLPAVRIHLQTQIGSKPAGSNLPRTRDHCHFPLVTVLFPHPSFFGRRDSC